jgi:uncharacterized protein
MDDTLLQSLVDRAAILEILSAIFRGADRRDWALCRSAFAEALEVDYGAPERLGAEALVERWRAALGALDMTQHLVSNYHLEVQGDTAQVTSEFIATHQKKSAPGGEMWTLGGGYEHTLARTPAGWRVIRMKMIPRWSTGNGGLIQEAMALR